MFGEKRFIALKSAIDSAFRIPRLAETQTEQIPRKSANVIKYRFV
jgi:hypothetical protein